MEVVNCDGILFPVEAMVIGTTGPTIAELGLELKQVSRWFTS